ncbi:hypothetical protein LEN26_000594 [Aphanomyces euteiches]|nr:hypothetical protein LEN26_000594 [Aphanomyces euteiches]
MEKCEPIHVSVRAKRPRDISTDPVTLLGQRLKEIATITRATTALVDTDIYSWGYGFQGSCGHNNTVSCEFPVPIAAFRRNRIQHCSAGRNLSLFLDDLGQVFQSGQMSDWATAAQWKPERVGGLPRILTTAAGAKAAYAISAPRRIAPFHVQRKGSSNELESNADGGVLYSWGCGDFGQLGHGDDENVKIPRPIAGLETVRVALVRAGTHFAAAVTDSGVLYTWGNGRHGQLGHNSTESEPSPRRVEGLSIVVDVSLGSTHALAVAGSMVFAWGQQQSGCLGIGGQDRDVLVPTKVMFFRHMQTSKVSAGIDHSLFLCIVGVKTFVYACGSNRFGQLGINSTIAFSEIPQCIEEFEYAGLTRRVAQIQAGDRFSIALLGIVFSEIVSKLSVVTGEVLAWGDNMYHKSAHSKARRLTCVPWVIDSIAHRFALQVAVEHSHGLVLFRRDDKVMDRFRRFPIRRLVAFLHRDEVFPTQLESVVELPQVHDLCSPRKCPQTILPPFGMFYRCKTCQVQPICRRCARHCHVDHAIEWEVLDRIPHSCQCLHTSLEPYPEEDNNDTNI